MPFKIVKVPGKTEWQVKTTDTGKVHGTHPSKKAAVQQLRALYANVPEAKE